MTTSSRCEGVSTAASVLGVILNGVLQEFQYGAVELFRPLPVGGVSGLAHDHDFAVGDLRRHHPDERRWRVEVGLTCD